MFRWVLDKLRGASNGERALAGLQPLVGRINELEGGLAARTDDELTAAFGRLRERHAAGEPLEALECESFALTREASRRALGLRHFDVQILGGLALQRGAIAEMGTGEGKTLVATLPAALEALGGRGVHVVTVNDYLARRDAEWMGRVYARLGLTVGVVHADQSPADKRSAYRADVTYAHNAELGFDWLRDATRTSIFDCVQRPLHFAIVDEVDSILIDEARVPLIISGAGLDASAPFRRIDALVPRLRREEHWVVADEATRVVSLTESGVDQVERLLGIDNLYDPEHVELLHVVEQCLRAHALFQRDVHYVVAQDGEVLIVDEHTGRTLPGRRWTDGLHQAIEAKERVEIRQLSSTIATTTYQNLFRLYDKLSGMTGTAASAAEELRATYGLDVVVVPPNRPVLRVDHGDQVFRTEADKFRAIVEDVVARHARGQPVLVGTTSVERSEALSALLARVGIDNQVLSAKHHAEEAHIVAQAGRKGAVTVATNMAGRGTDILLGGNPDLLAAQQVVAADPADLEDEDWATRVLGRWRTLCAAERDEVLAAGGLHVIGSERHDARRIDDQLRGRAGRQGDPGSSRFYASLEDDWVREQDGGERDAIVSLLTSPGPTEHPRARKWIDRAQKRIEELHFEARQHVLEYDDVLDRQRKAVYGLRRRLIEGRFDPPAAGEPEPPPLPTMWLRRLHRMAEGILLTYGLAPGETEPAPIADDPNAPEPQIDSFVGVHVEGLEREVYYRFGVRIDATPVAHDPRAAIDLIHREVAEGLRGHRARMLGLVRDTVELLIERHGPGDVGIDGWDSTGLTVAIRRLLHVEPALASLPPGPRALHTNLVALAERQFEAKELERNADVALRMFQTLWLDEIDRQWVEQLQSLTALREGIALRAYGRLDPKLEYQREAFERFTEMMGNVQVNSVSRFFHVQMRDEIDAIRQTLRHEES